MDEIYALSNAGDDILIIPTMLNFSVCVIFALLLRLFYLNNSGVVGSKLEFSNLIPFLSLIVFLVITVVKSSLALSLGLVGALSIVRFRTPIKDPEDLIYLFFAIGLGIGFGAGQFVITASCSLAILLTIYLLLKKRNSSPMIGYNLMISWKAKGIEFVEIEELLIKNSIDYNLIRLDTSNVGNSAILAVEVLNRQGFDTVLKELKSRDNSVAVTFYGA